MSEDSWRPRMTTLEERSARTELSVEQLRSSMQKLADNQLEQGRTLVGQAGLMTKLAEDLRDVRESAREARQRASEVADSVVHTAGAIDRHISGLVKETATQSDMLRRLASWNNGPWVKSAIVLGAAVGGFVAAMLARGCH